MLSISVYCIIAGPERVSDMTSKPFSVWLNMLDERIDTTLMSVPYIWSYSQETVNSVKHEDWQQGSAASLALSKVNKICL